MGHDDLNREGSKHEDPGRSARIREEELDELDARLLAWFRTIDGPMPSGDFAARTMRAVSRAPLPSGRRALRSGLASLVGWAALIAGVALSALTVAMTQPVFASIFSQVISRGIGMGVWLMQFRNAAFVMLDVLATTGLAVSRAAATREGTTGLLLVAVMGALSLSALHRLLISQGERQQWQELS
jgi:hypothetical protein